MKKMKWLVSLVLCASMLTGMGSFAAEVLEQSSDKATIVFDAEKKQFYVNNLPITYTGEEQDQKYPDLFPTMKNLFPGDEVTQEITVKVQNAGSSKVRLRLKAEDPSAEDDRNPTNDDYETLMSYKTESGEGVDLSVVIDKTRYSGELTGLAADATKAADEGVYLGEYTADSAEKNLKVTLSIPLEAGNELQGLVAHLGWVITAEVIEEEKVDPKPEDPKPEDPKPEDPKPEEPDPVVVPDDNGGEDDRPGTAVVDTPTETIPDEEVPTTDIEDEEPPLAEMPEEEVPLAEAPKTGDASFMWLAMSGASGAGLLALQLTGRKKEEA